MVGACHASYFCRLLSCFRCCRSSRRLGGEDVKVIVRPDSLGFAHGAPQPAALVYRSSPKLLRVRWRLALFRPAWLLRWSLQWRQLRPLLDADADRADLELRLINLMLKDHARVHPFAGNAAHGTFRTSRRYSSISVFWGWRRHRVDGRSLPSSAIPLRYGAPAVARPKAGQAGCRRRGFAAWLRRRS